MRRAGPTYSDRRVLRPPAWPPEHRRPMDPNRQRPAFTVLLLYASRNQRRDLPVSVVDTLIEFSPSPPVQTFIHSSGVVAGRLLFNRWSEALEAAVLFWTRRLDGTHTLNTVIEASRFAPPHNRAEEECRLRTLFSERIRGLLDCDAVRKCEEKILKVTDEIHKLHRLLSRPKSYVWLDNLTDKRKRLEVEREQLKGRLVEFRAAVECLLAQIAKDPDHVLSNEDNKGDVEIFKLESKIDWSKLHRLMERERRRLEEGLPIYACRKKILSYIFANQAVVLIGETGSGKSTQLVQFLADCGMGGEGSILCTQPRKLAATSLAQRVTQECDGCYPNNFISSYASYSSFQQFGSGVIFMTDHCLLQHYMSNSSLPGISCIVIDEAHERSLSSDLLFALIKKKLVEYSNLRLVIMSATADASTLAKYFFGCYTFNIMGRNFPVDIKYISDVPSKPYGSAYQKNFYGKCSSYVFDVLNMVSMIHKTEEAGDILAFLTSQSEVEWACEIFNDPSAVVLPLHGKLSSEEQSLVFQIYPGKRKVIFSTNVAETSLTIKDVKFVIDPGMVKESRFEPSNGMNVLKVCRISQSSANQRAGRAGRTEPGKCYRLYSESDFQAMQMHQDPEIRKVHLGVAVLRILALGIKNVQEFEFVDAPCPKAIEIAIKNLIQLGAVTSKNDGVELSDTGRNIVKLGVEPRVGKIILDCLDYGLRKEGLVLAAMMVNASSIFCRVGSNEDKFKADCLRVPFCHHSGDLFTLLSVYMKWEAEHSNRNSWCWENSINAKSMRRCHEAVSELENCLQQELSIIIPSFWLWSPDEPSNYDKLLKKVILLSLAGNLAMYSGYDQLGYEVALTGQHVQLHPSSSLLVYGQKPGWVVFGEILSLPNQYLVCVTAVDYDVLCTIEPLLFDVSKLESRKMQMNVISGFGTNVVKRFCGKQNQNFQRTISHIRRVCSDERVSIEIEFDTNKVHVYASMKDLKAVSCIVKDSLEYERKHLRNECMEKCLFLGRTGTCPPLALFGSGAEIKYLELKNRCLSIEISHPNAYNLHDKELILMVEDYVSGIVSVYKFAGGQEGVDKNKWGRITFLNPELAEEAVSKLNGLELDGSLLKVVAIKTGDQKMLPFPAVRAKVLWPRKPSKGIALVTCAPGEVEFVKNDCFALAVGDRFVNCEVSTRYPNCLFVTGLPKDVSEAEMYDAFTSLTNRRILDIHILRGETVPTPPLSSCEAAIRREISQFMPKKHFRDQYFRVEVFNPEQRDYMIRAAITFDGSLHLEAAKALDHMQGNVLPGFLSWQKIQCQHVFQTSLCCSSRVYGVIRGQLNSILENFKCQRGVSYNLEQTLNGSYRVRISANATKTIADLRKPLEQLMQGITISHPNLTSTVLQLILGKDGVALMKSVERETSTYVLYDRQNLKVRVFGPPKEVSAAEEKLIQSLLSLHENKQLEIHLRGYGLPSSLMKEVVQRFGSDLSGLREKVNEVEVTLNTRRHIVSVRGSKEMKQKVETLISEVAQSIGQNVAFEQPPSESSCPICLCELEEPYKLEDCGHEFCRSCLVDQFESAIRSHDQLPVCCIMDGCKKLILLVDLKSLLAAERLEELFRASLSSFVASSDGAYRFCPSPDCPSVYRVHDNDADVGPFVCGACFVETCTRCHLEYHPCISCERYKEYKTDPDLSLTDWCKGKENVKSCPACRHTIEKVEGCNHIECKCGWHICWVCLESFRSSEECYKHLNSVHQSFI